MEPLILLKSPSSPLLHSTNPLRRLRLPSAPHRRLRIRREPPRCALGDPSLSDSLLLAAAATAAAFSVLRVVYSRRNSAFAGFSDTDISSNTSVKDVCLGHIHADPKFNTEISENGTTYLALFTLENDDLKQFEGTNTDAVELKRDCNSLSASNALQSHLVEYTETLLKAMHTEIEATGEVISACVPQMPIKTRNVELEIIKELLLANQAEYEEVSLFKDLSKCQSQSGINSQVNNVVFDVTGCRSFISEETFGGPCLTTSTTLLKNPIGLNLETQRSEPISFVQNQSQHIWDYSLQKRTGPSLRTLSLSRRFQIPKAGSILAAESEELMPTSITEGASATGEKEIANYISGGNENLKSQSGHMTKLVSGEEKVGSPPSNGTVFKDNTDGTRGLSSYEHLLQQGRLSQCVDLLENMEMKGFLDMDKVHHASFLKKCRAQKAVAEAFRFAKLIKNPTLRMYSMVLFVCASAQDYEGALQVMQLVKDAELRPDCQLYNAFILTCGKSGKVDAMFEAFHEMVHMRNEPDLYTYGALIDGCARAGQVAKAFGAYGIMRSKNVKPDRVIFNTLITACGKTGAVDRAFDVLAEMMAVPITLDPDHVTVGALIKACTQVGQVDRAREVYQMLKKFKIRGTAEVYTIAVNSCSLNGNLEFALNIYDDMKNNGIAPDEMFLSTIIDVAGHAGNVDAAFEILRDARQRGSRLGIVSYSSLMGACSKAKNWQKALELYEDLVSLKLQLTTSTVNALITSLCDAGKLQKAVEIFHETKEAGVRPNSVTYSILILACGKNDEANLGCYLLSQAKKDGILLNLDMCGCLIVLCMRRQRKAYAQGEPILSFNSGGPQIDSTWMKGALMAYRETISAGLKPSAEMVSRVLGCLKFPKDISFKRKIVLDLGIRVRRMRWSNLCSLLDGFGEYDPRAFAICEEAHSLGIVPGISYKKNPIVVDVRKLPIFLAEVYILTLLKSLKHHLAAGAVLPNMAILLPTEKTQILQHGGKTIHLPRRVGQAVIALLRRLRLRYQGDERSNGSIWISGLTIKKWLQPKIDRERFGLIPSHLSPSHSRLAKKIAEQQRSIRSNSYLTVPPVDS